VRAPPLAPLVAWGRELGLRGPPEHATARPWSTTVCLDGTWLKACGPGGRHEAALLHAARRWQVPSVVLPVAVHLGHGYLALPDAGTRLRDLPGGSQRVGALLAEHALLQRALQQHVDEAVDVGVPDLRPARVPAAVTGLLARTALPAEVRAAVQRALPEPEERCALLDTGPVGATVQHDDLRDGNVFVDPTGTARALDWGDCSVGHPFGVLLVTLRALRTRLADGDVARARDAYLEVWTDLADRATLRALAVAAVQVQAAARALSWDRALLAADAAERHRWGRPWPGGSPCSPASTATAPAEQPMSAKSSGGLR
jgi:hypothetical protein